jgi:superfamily II DNA helicase RecQ
MMIQRQQSLLAILGTGSGKTMMILLQATIQRDLVTIVVLPLSSLHEDLKRRAIEKGVPYSRWTPNGKFNDNASVISVSIEHLGFHDFIK